MSSRFKNLISRHSATKRGDTIIEVVFAIAIFSLVAVSSMAIMNVGVARSQGALEMTTVRSELNAQAEALRFVHSSYIAERTLPLDRINSDGSVNERYQQYRALWEKIVENAIDSQTARDNGLYEYGTFINSNVENGVSGCGRVYMEDDAGKNYLKKQNAFIINTRNMSSLYPQSNTVDLSITYISSNDAETEDVFQQAPMTAQIIFGRYNASASDADSTSEFTDKDTKYRYVKRAEGVWVIAVKSDQTAYRNGYDTGRPEFFDFYIQSCWYSMDSATPTSIDTAIRLYNPENF